MISCLFSNCDYVTGAAIESDAPVPAPKPVPRTEPLEPEPCGILDATGVSVHLDKAISFHGCSTLPDGTELLTQLYADKEPAKWWPSDECYKIHQGTWEVTVSLAGLSEETTGLFIGNETIFSFKIWQKDDPSVTAQYIFDLLGPPPAPEP